ncbi:MAG: DUF3857 and transglutaminase domain-containing protein [Acidobacteria bacterium]|nr:DUF3857 and transglutaminase domain-containing protein [Acidobacteriota bacterium]
MRTLSTISSLCGLMILLFTSLDIRAKEDWRAIDPTHLKMTAPIIEKDADAEALRWEIRVEKDIDKAVVTHYVLIKIFNDRGRESQGTIEIPYYDKLKIKDVMARTIKANGQIVYVNPSDIFDKQVVRARKFKVNVISFAMPGVEPGALIEYSWKEEYKSADFVRVDLQRDVPVQVLKLYLKGKNAWGVNQRVQYFNLPPLAFQPDDKGYLTTTLPKIPAFRAEPMMPAEDFVRPWMLVYTQYPGSYSLWEVLGKAVYEETKAKTKLNDELRQKATELAGKAQTADEKLARIYEFCRTGIRNLDNSNVTDAESKASKENKNAADTLRNRMGTGRDINLLFIALANAAGFDARQALLADRSQYAFNKNFTGTYYMATMLESYNVAIRMENQWRFFDPASTYVSFGMLLWQEEGQEALITDPFQPIFVQTPLSAPEKSLIKRTGTLQLSEDGTLEGALRLEYTGHLAAENRDLAAALTEQKRDEDFLKRIKAQIPNAEVSQVKIENLTDITKPLVYSYHVKVPNYAQRTSKRLIFTPAYFQGGNTTLFSASTRQHPILFSFPWSEKDEVTIELPMGFGLDNATGIVPLDANGILGYQVNLSVTKDDQTFYYKRDFFFGGKGVIAFPVSAYQNLKLAFDTIQQRDNQQITLIQKVLAAK